MKSIIALAALLMAGSASAAAINTSYTFDNNHNSSVGVQASEMLTKDVGVAVDWNQYYKSTGNYTSNDISLVVDHRSKQYSITGNIGLGKFTDRSTPFAEGDINITDRLTKLVTVNVEGYTGTVDSSVGLQKGLTLQGYNVGMDITNDKVGLVVLGKQTFYSNGNVRSGEFAKAYVSVYPGINLYVNEKYFEDSRPNNGDFWSPASYTRYDIGVSARHRWNGYLLTGFYERGRAWFSNQSVGVATWRVRLEKPVNKKWVVGADVGSDMSDSNYDYHYADLNIKYKF